MKRADEKWMYLNEVYINFFVKLTTTISNKNRFYYEFFPEQQKKRYKFLRTQKKEIMKIILT